MLKLTLGEHDSIDDVMARICPHLPFDTLMLHTSRHRLGYTLLRQMSKPRRESDIIPWQAHYLLHVRVPRQLADGPVARRLRERLFELARLSYAWDPRSQARRTLPPHRRALFVSRQIAARMLPMRVHTDTAGATVYTPRAPARRVAAAIEETAGEEGEDIGPEATAA